MVPAFFEEQLNISSLLQKFPAFYCVMRCKKKRIVFIFVGGLCLEKITNKQETCLVSYYHRKSTQSTAKYAIKFGACKLSLAVSSLNCLSRVLHSTRTGVIALLAANKLKFALPSGSSNKFN